MAYLRGYFTGYNDTDTAKRIFSPQRDRRKKNRTPGYYMEWFNGRTRLVWME